MKLELMLLMLVAIVGWSSGDESKNDRHDYSINRKLVKTIKESMDTEANPCLAFHKYACGKWSIPDRTSIEHAMFVDVSMELIKYMDDTDMTDMPEFAKKAYDFYTSCTDTLDISDLNIIHYMEQHENMSWALLSSTEDTESVFDWARTLGLMRTYGMNNVFVEEMMSVKTSDPSKNIIDLKRPVTNGGYRPLQDYMIDSLIASEDLPLDNQELWKKIVEFEERLKKVNAIETDSDERLITVKELPLSWLNKYLDVIVQPKTLDSNMELTIKNIPYMEALDALLKEYDAKFLCRYLEIRFLQYFKSDIYTNMDKSCIEKTRILFPMAMHWIYEQLHPELPKEIPKIQHMFNNIIETINKTVGSERNGGELNKFAYKLDSMQLKVGNLPRVDTIKVLDSHYAPLKLNTSDIYGNRLQLLKLYFYAEQMRTTNDLEINANQYFNEMERREYYWKMMRPYYLPAENIIVLPVELLRPPFYHWGYDDIFKYGSIGSILVRYIFDEFDYDYDMTGYVSVGTTAGIVFTSFPEELKEKPYSFTDMDMPMKKLFFLNAAQYFCEDGIRDTVHRNFARIPEFNETFECK